MVLTGTSGSAARDTVLVLDGGPAHPGSDGGYTVRSPECPREARPRLSKFHAPEIVFGPDSLPESAHAAVRLGARRPFVVTDPGVTEAGWPAELLRYLRSAGLQPQLWNDITPNPKDHEIQAGFERYQSSGCDVVVGIGGGSVIDAAKGVALLAANGGTILDYEGIDRISNPIPPLVMVPSTSGTGADVSQFCIITDTERLTKITIMGRALVPDVSVIDPRLLVTMPDWLNAATGLDALTHGIEAFVSLAHGPLTDTHALHAVALVHANLPTTMIRRHDDGPRTAMAQAALEAGLAFTNAILGATHAMSHQVGGMLDLPHGLINGVLLPHVIRFNGAQEPTRFVPIAQAMGLPARPGIPGDEAVDMVATEVRKLADEVGVPTGLGAIGVREADVPRLARLTLGDACLTTNPRTATVAQIEDLFREAL
ncbi:MULTISPECIES: iron-containing alcohol dehydrogenase [Pseudonocardia]|uniref:1,3-propanediol dehydrogenase n=2 Tax=Pseudonocardia TaxID=1847 RepID=A0A1Y2N916_PSEAH|nr:MULTISPECIES: iron-containing alcohol dehydrogenase [Pseudonocardia]OSY43975.1 1,3-propanediol dehydrogenase [Pseudonocardia autotrophica]TDN74292.1 alcohol dehydrogenase class IV [Pseudonocardia autotrophica]BBG05055.1 1,3-propanediol dehydrogenase [Pseudonocardia autotrophica]GEC27956.1 1,3-propanediol dehydrogenase [Pseudonocardia saturnea]